MQDMCKQMRDDFKHNRDGIPRCCIVLFGNIAWRILSVHACFCNVTHGFWERNRGWAGEKAAWKTSERYSQPFIFYICDLLSREGFKTDYVASTVVCIEWLFENLCCPTPIQQHSAVYHTLHRTWHHIETLHQLTLNPVGRVSTAIDAASSCGTQELPLVIKCVLACVDVSY